jgi:simple sugar transport system permease protein
MGITSGALAATIMAILAVSLRADQIIVGVGVNILAFGVTAFFANELFPAGEVPVISRPERIALPLLSEIPGIGDALFNQTPLVYIAYLTIPLVSLVLVRTRFGLSVRATGEMPAAVDTAGVSVAFVRWAGVHTAGALAGLGGALLCIGELGFFREGITAGRGFLAFAAVIFGGWRPVGVLVACLIFGAADALQLRLQAEAVVPRAVWVVILLGAVLYLAMIVRTSKIARRTAQLAIGSMVSVGALTLFIVEPAWSLPSQFWLALPYILTLLALSGFVRRGQAPRAWGVPYDRLRT